jgi:hypothetical protein
MLLGEAISRVCRPFSHWIGCTDIMRAIVVKVVLFYSTYDLPGVSNAPLRCSDPNLGSILLLH